MSGFLGRIIEAQVPAPTTYVEPFAGGAGAALRLLVDEYVDHVVLNDLDPGVAAVWQSVFHHTEDFARRIEAAEVSVEAWRLHHETYKASHDSADPLELGFATFFLNRTNRSGILRARPIGGLNQAGAWKIGARYNREELARRVRLLGNYRNRVTVCQEDGVALLSSYLTPESFVYADPPYLVRGSDLYMNALGWEDHRRLARVLTASRGRWMVTYDHDERVPNLFARQRIAEFSIAHTAAKPHIGREYAVFANGLAIPGLSGLGKHPDFITRTN